MENKYLIDKPAELLAIEALDEKLKEYSKRYSLYMAPELQMGTICKHYILKAVLERGSVTYDRMFLELSKLYGGSMHQDKFINAFAVIKAYCEGREDEVIHR